MECMGRNIRKVHRNWAWAVQTFLSITVMCSIFDNISPSNMRDVELFAFIASMIPLVTSVIILAMHYIKYFNKFVGGTLFELVMAILLLGIWIVAAVVIEDPQNNIATTVSPTGVELVKEGNLYFLTWFALFSNVYLVGSFFRDYRTYDLRVLGWISLLAGSLILLGVSSHLKDGICNADDEVICFRIKYAMVSSSVASGISLTASVLSYISKISTRLGLILISPVATMYSFGVVVLTSANGPGQTLGTIYFTIWIGSSVSILLLIGEFNQVVLYGEEAKKTAEFNPQQAVQMGGDICIASSKEKSFNNIDTNDHTCETVCSSGGAVSDGESVTPEIVKSNPSYLVAESLSTVAQAYEEILGFKK